MRQLILTFLFLLSLPSFAAWKIPLLKPASVLLVYAHPDDESAIGGVLGRLKEAGVAVSAIYLTRGEGSPRNHVDPEGLSPELHVGVLRPKELLNVSAYFGFKDLVQLAHADAGYTTNPEEFLSTGLWDTALIEREIQALALKVEPTVVITMLPRHEAIHAHHQLTGQIVLKLLREGRLGPWVEAVYGEPELDWLPAGAFAREEEAGLRFSRRLKSALSGKTWGDYQLEGAHFHLSQDTAYPDRLTFNNDYEVLTPLFEKPGTESVIRTLYRAEQCREFFY